MVGLLALTGSDRLLQGDTQGVPALAAETLLHPRIGPPRLRHVMNYLSVRDAFLTIAIMSRPF